jgi:23S rRNA (uracil1939-C5)-methyltransferase
MVGPEPDKVLGRDEMIYTTRQAVYQVSAGAFFQSNRFLIDDLVDLVTAGRSGALALELYAGVGLFAVPLARNFRQVVAVEAAPYSHKDLVANAPRSLRAVQTTTEEFLKKGHLEQRPDLIVLDPPRAGLGEEVAAQVGRLDAPTVLYVSCDPATLARDLRVLLETGYRIARAHLIDLFPQTFHIESVFELVR